MQFNEQNGADRFYDCLDERLNKRVNSFHVVNELLEILRVIFNYCRLKIKKQLLIGLLSPIKYIRIKAH